MPLYNRDAILNMAKVGSAYNGLALQSPWLGLVPSEALSSPPVSALSRHYRAV